MPIPFLIAAGAILFTTVLGAEGHSEAKETNEKAQRVADHAQDLYNETKKSLDQSRERAESSLSVLGYAKGKVMEDSMMRFLRAYDYIKTIKLTESIGLDETYKFMIHPQDAIQLRNMSNVYHAAFSSGLAGAATGTAIALAAGGSLPIITGAISVGGSLLMTGEITGLGIMGSAVSFGAAMTPLAAVVAPVVLFTGVSASIKADENLEKAQAMSAEAEAAAEQMKTSKILCIAIAGMADKLKDLLKRLDGMFSGCVQSLDNIVYKKISIYGARELCSDDFTRKELMLIAVTRSLAGAVKAIIDTPILNEDGTLSIEASKTYDKISTDLPKLSGSVITDGI